MGVENNNLLGKDWGFHPYNKCECHMDDNWECRLIKWILIKNFNKYLFVRTLPFANNNKVESVFVSHHHKIILESQ